MNREELEQAILAELRNAERLLDVKSSLHYGANVAVLEFKYEQGGSMYQQGWDLRKLIMAYRAACTPGAKERIEEAEKLREAAHGLEQQARALVSDIPSDAVEFFRNEKSP